MPILLIYSKLRQDFVESKKTQNGFFPNRDNFLTKQVLSKCIEWLLGIVTEAFSTHV